MAEKRQVIAIFSDTYKQLDDLKWEKHLPSFDAVLKLLLLHKLGKNKNKSEGKGNGKRKERKPRERVAKSGIDNISI